MHNFFLFHGFFYNNQSSGLELVKLSYLDDYADRKTYISTWLTCCQHIKHRCPWVIYTYQPCCKTWKNITNEYCHLPWNTTKANQKTLNRSNILWSWFSRFLVPPSTLSYNSSKRFPELVKSIFMLLDNFLGLSLWSLNGIFWHTVS